MIKARIIGTGSCLPDRVMTNRDLEQIIETSDEWIATRTGIRERRIAAEGENTSDLAARAAVRALEMAGIDGQDIDLIVLGTITADYPWPATACLVQDKIGAIGCAALDVSAACSGFIYALDMAARQIEAGAVRRALVIGAEVLSRIIDWEDRNTCVLFGDGAGAVVLEACEDGRGVLNSCLHADGRNAELLYQPGFSTRFVPSAQGIADRLPYLKMQGNEVFKIAVRSMADVATEALGSCGLSHTDVNYLIPHQANRRIIDATAKRLKLNDDQVYINVDRYANTSGATIPIALDEMVRGGLIDPGHVLVFAAFGGGFTWAASVIRW